MGLLIWGIPRFLGPVRWLRFAHWATGQEIDPLGLSAAQIAAFLYSLFDTHGLSRQTIEGYRSCLASVLNHVSKTAAVQNKAADMVTSMELRRPRITLVLPQWDLCIVLESLSKPPYEPLLKASLKPLNLKTVFLLAMASAGRRSELQALVFDSSKAKWADVSLNFSPKFMRKS